MRKRLLTISILLLFVVLVVPMFSAQKKGEPEPWPLAHGDIVKTAYGGWSEGFYSLDQGRDLYRITPLTDGYQAARIYRFSFPAEHSRHVVFSGSDVILAWSNRKNLFELVVFDQDRKVKYRERVKTEYQISDATIRFDRGIKPVILWTISNKEGQNGVVVWYDDRSQVLLEKDNPVLDTYLDWQRQSIHIVSADDVKTNWYVWESGLLKKYPLPFTPVNVKLFYRNNSVYLLAMDSRHNLYLLSRGLRTLGSRRLIQSDLFGKVRKIVPMEVDGRAVLFCEIPNSGEILILQASDLLNGANQRDIREYKRIARGKTFPGTVDGKIVWLESIEGGPSYYSMVSDQKNPLINFTWNIEASGDVLGVVMRWQNRPPGARYEYRYIFDEKPESLPLPEFRQKGNTLRITGAEEGNYYLHIQAREIGKEGLSPVYHIPVFWKFVPSVPEIEVVGRISANVITGNELEFVIKNLEEGQYYARVDQIPEYDPVEALNHNNGRASFKVNFKPGQYFLHLRVRDPKTGQISPTLHYRFFYQTQIIEQTVGVGDYNNDFARMRELVYKLEQATNEEEILRLKEELRKLEEELRGVVEKGTQDKKKK